MKPTHEQTPEPGTAPNPPLNMNKHPPIFNMYGTAPNPPMNKHRNLEPHTHAGACIASAGTTRNHMRTHMRTHARAAASSRPRARLSSDAVERNLQIQTISPTDLASKPSSATYTYSSTCFQQPFSEHATIHCSTSMRLRGPGPCMM